MAKKTKQPTGAPKTSMEALYEASLQHIKEGEIVEGRVIDVRENEVIVDIGYKSEGLIPVAEFKSADEVKPGDRIEVLIEKLEDDHGMVVVSKRRAEQQRNWDRVLANYQEGGTIKGAIKGRVKGGLIVDVGVDAFLPGSQLDVVPVRILYDTPDGRMKLFCKVKVVYGEPMPAAQFAMESRRDLKTLRANKQALLDAWEELGQQA